MEAVTTETQGYPAVETRGSRPTFLWRRRCGWHPHLNWDAVLIELCVDVETRASSELRVDTETRAWRELRVEAETQASSELRVDAETQAWVSLALKLRCGPRASFALMLKCRL